jgi:hypothetical protein
MGERRNAKHIFGTQHHRDRELGIPTFIFAHFKEFQPRSKPNTSHKYDL